MQQLTGRYVTSDDIKHTGGYEQRIHDMSIDGWLGQEWLAKYVDWHQTAL